MFTYLKYISPTVNGEPFTNRNFYRELGLIEKFKVRLCITTNGTLIPKGKDLDRIINNLYSLTVSFDAARKKTYEKIRRFARYENVINNIKIFNKIRKQIKKEERPFLGFHLVLMRSNIEELCEWVELAKDLEVDNIAVVHALIFDKELSKESLIYHKGLANYHIAKARKLAQGLGFQAEEFPPLYSNPADTEQSFNFINNEPCGFLRREAFIELDGTVYPCCGLLTNDLRMGNIKVQTFEDIWNGPRYRALRRSFKMGNMLPQCKTCYHRLNFINSDIKEQFILYKE